MKNVKRALCLILAMFMLLLVSCGDVPEPSGSIDENEQINSDSQQTQNTQAERTESTEHSLEPPLISNYYFDSYEEFNQWLSKDMRRIPNISESLREKLNSLWETIDKSEVSYIMPLYNEKNIEYRNLDGYSNIIFLPSDLFGEPRAWFYCKVNGFDVEIRETIIGTNNIDQIELNSQSKTIRNIAPSAPNTDNFELFDGYRSIEEVELNLLDRKVSALEYRSNDRSGLMISFVYNNVLVFVYAPYEALTAEFWSKLSFE